jgi:hypothetical protein
MCLVVARTKKTKQQFAVNKKAGYIKNIQILKTFGFFKAL